VREILEGDEFNHQLLKHADYAGNTVLHLAAVGPEPLVLRELLMRGASVHARNRANNTPLYLAEKMGNAECVRLLKEAGAHLWLDNELKGEGSRVPSQGVSRAVSPERGGSRAQPNGGGPVGEAHGKEGKDEAAAERNVEVVGNGVALAQVEPARSLLTGDKGRFVG
jgi:lysophospholipase